MKKPWYKRIADRRPPDVVILADHNGKPYLRRWHLIPRNRLFNIYLHNFVGSDKRVLHDHPWASLAYQLSGELKERYQKLPGTELKGRIISKGAWTYRGSKFLHFLHLWHLNGPEVWTIFMTGPKLREWGFLTDTGWRHWQRVIHDSDYSPSRDGGY